MQSFTRELEEQLVLAPIEHVRTLLDTAQAGNLVRGAEQLSIVDGVFHDPLHILVYGDDPVPTTDDHPSMLDALWDEVTLDVGGEDHIGRVPLDHAANQHLITAIEINLIERSLRA